MEQQKRPVGRPRFITPQPDECIKLGEEMLEFFTEETEEFRFLFSQWYSLKKHILRKDWKNLIVAPEFSPYYEEVKTILAIKCVNGDVKEGFGQRYLRLHDRDVAEEEDDVKKYDAQLRKDVLRDTADIIVQTINYSTHLKDKSIAENKDNS